MILIFDLDDTLYPEITYVKSGFLAVSDFIFKKFDLDKDLSYKILLKILERDGRGKIFDSFLKENNIYSKKNVKECISIYRNHTPYINLYSDARKCINRFKDLKKYIVTDGNILVQRNKTKSLGLNSYFDKIITTHQYGIKYGKPSVFCFKMIMRLENCIPSEMVYVGDNPYKDFINIKKLGIRTVRILRGSFKDIKLDQSYEAEFTINSLDKLTKKFIRRLYEDR